MSIHNYALKFRTVTTATRWNECSLLTTYRQGLNPRLLLHLATYGGNIGLEKFSQTSIQVSNRVQQCNAELEGSLSSLNPRQSRQVLQNQIQNPCHWATQGFRLLSGKGGWPRVIVCTGAGGHAITTCPVHPPRPVVSFTRDPSVDQIPLTTKVHISVSDAPVSLSALNEYGSAGNFISGNLCCQLQFQKTLILTHCHVQSIVGKPLSCQNIRYRVGPLHLRIGISHCEDLHFWFWSTLHRTAFWVALD